jgi:hypothetical protein
MVSEGEEHPVYAAALDPNAVSVEIRCGGVWVLPFRSAFVLGRLLVELRNVSGCGWGDW